MAKKEKVLILSYYFPPCNLTPSERIFSWARYLKKGDYYPIIITRNWDLSVTNSTTAAFQSSGDKVRIEKHDDYEVHYLPYTSSLKDKAFIKLDGTKFYFLYLILAFVSNLTNLIFVKRSAFSSFYYYTRSLLEQEQDIDKMVVSASPYELFGIAYNLSKSNQISWIADYRDAWGTNEMQYADNLPKQIFRQFSSYFEKKWLKTANSFVTVSDYYKNKISLYIKKEGRVLANGFLPENYKSTPPLFDIFTLTYVGSVYPLQPIEKVIDAFIKFLNTDSQQTKKIRFLFVGIANEANIKTRIKRAILGYENYFEMTERLPKQQAIILQQKSHLLLSCAYGNLKGIPASKLYEYIALKKKVLVYPTDNDIIESTLTETRQGLICRDENDFIRNLSHYYTTYENNEFVSTEPADEEKMTAYTRENQTQILIAELDKLNK
jgi:glycosyltransferase involved in cell wall biosynthesis